MTSLHHLTTNGVYLINILEAPVTAYVERENGSLEPTQVFETAGLKALCVVGRMSVDGGKVGVVSGPVPAAINL